MGNTQASLRDKSPDWAEYSQAEWRSERSRELDKFGGLCRPAIARGYSITAKLTFLQGQLQQQRADIVQEVKRGMVKQKDVDEQTASYKRSLRSSANGVDSSSSPGPEQQGSRKNKNDTGPSAGQGQEVTSDNSERMLVAEWLKAVHRSVAEPQRVAEWRYRVHVARRRAFLIVLTVVRFQRALKGNSRRRKIRSVASFSFYIPAILGSDFKRFLVEQLKFSRLSVERASLRTPDLNQFRVLQPSACLSPKVNEENIDSPDRSLIPAYKQDISPATSVVSCSGDTNCTEENVNCRSELIHQPAAVASPVTSDQGSVLALSGLHDDSCTADSYNDLPCNLVARSDCFPGSDCTDYQAARSSDSYMHDKPSINTQSSNAGVPLTAEGNMNLGVSNNHQGGHLGSGITGTTWPSLVSSVRQYSRGRHSTSESGYVLKTSILAPTPPAKPVVGALPSSDGVGFMVPSKYGYTPAYMRSMFGKTVEPMFSKMPGRFSESGGLDASRFQTFQDRCSTFHSTLRPCSRQALLPALEATSYARLSLSSEVHTTSYNSIQVHTTSETAAQHSPSPHQAPPANDDARPSSSSSLIPGEGYATADLKLSTHDQEMLPSHKSFLSKALVLPRLGRTSVPGTGASIKMRSSCPGTSESMKTRTRLDLSSEHTASGYVGMRVRDDSDGNRILNDNVVDRMGRVHGVRRRMQAKDLTALGTVEGLTRGGRSAKLKKKEYEKEIQDDLKKFESDMKAAKQKEKEDRLFSAQRLQSSTESGRLMSMFLNRGNSNWVSSKPWCSPILWTSDQQEAWARSRDAVEWQDVMCKHVRKGSVAVQVMCLGRPLELPCGQSVEPWVCDPWDLSFYQQNGRGGQSGEFDQVHMQGIPLGCRVLMSIAEAAEARGGIGASRRMTVLLHLHDGMVDQAMQQIASFNFCGLKPENIWIMVQRRAPPYKYEPDQSRFVAADNAPTRCCGSGHALMQLNWVGEAMSMDRMGQLTPMAHTVVEGLEEKGVKWIVSRQGRDMSLLHSDGCLDDVLLPFTMAAHKMGVAQSTLQAVTSLNLSETAQGQGTGRPIVVGRTAGSSPRLLTCLDASSATVQALLPLLPAAEVREVELQAGSAKNIMKSAKMKDQSYALGVERYCFHISVLKGLVGRPCAFRPKLLMHDDKIYVRMDAGDILAQDSVALCLAARHELKTLTSFESFSGLVPVLKAQEQRPGFRLLAQQRHVALPSGLTILIPQQPPQEGPLTASSSAAFTSRAQVIDTWLQRVGSDRSSPHAAINNDDTNKSIGRRAELVPLTDHALRKESIYDRLRRKAAASDVFFGMNKNRFDHGRVGCDLREEVLTSSLPTKAEKVGRRHPDDGGNDKGPVNFKVSLGPTALEDLSSGAGSCPQSIRNVVVFISSNIIGSAAVEAAIRVVKPGRDVIHLVTVVTGHIHVEAGQALLEHYCPQVDRALVKMHKKVLVLEDKESQLVSKMDDYVKACGADLVVLATKALSRHVLTSSAVLGSITVSAMKRMSTPLLIINAHCAVTVAASKERPLKALAIASRHSPNMVEFLCKILEPLRGDSLVLGHPQSSSLVPFANNKSVIKS